MGLLVAGDLAFLMACRLLLYDKCNDLMSDFSLHNTLQIATFNIHKGTTPFNTRLSLYRQRDLLQQLHADVVFLQEVRDVHGQHSQRFSTWPKAGQMAFLTEHIWDDFSYGKNAVYPDGHHGNAILSKFPIVQTRNHDISAHPIEQRGMLHCEINLPLWDVPLHAVCVHFGLFAHWRRQQVAAVSAYIEQYVPSHEPLIIAGDFNDWNLRTGRLLARQLNMHEVFEQHHGRAARSFPSWMPMLPLDRIYVRGFTVKHAQVHGGAHFMKVSDHAILSATLTKK